MGISPNRAETEHKVALGASAIQPAVSGIIEVTFRRGPAEVAPYLDWELRPVSSYTECHISFELWRSLRRGKDLFSAGHCADAEFRSHFPGNGTVARFAALAARVREYGGGTTGGTREQMQCLEQHKGRWRGKPDAYGIMCEVLREHGLYEVGEWRGSDGKGKPRPYAFGSAWLLPGIPADLEADIMGALGLTA